MTAIGELTVVPVRSGSMSDQIAAAIEALDAFDVDYEVHAMGTVFESETASELFAAASAVHDAVDEERVITTLRVDDKRTARRTASEKVASVERQLSSRGAVDE
ncbi:MAG: MTH1187 family thiamine-binding protein [Halanaeroarchaeum sp.]